MTHSNHDLVLSSSHVFVTQTSLNLTKSRPDQTALFEQIGALSDERSVRNLVQKKTNLSLVLIRRERERDPHMKSPHWCI